jgi:hypothetical protein
MNKETPKQSVAAQKFWDAFQACVEDNRVRPDRSPFYVKWAQTFVDFQPGKRLRQRSRQDIEAFLADLARRPGIEDWQVRQAAQSLKILYESFLPAYAPESTTKPAKEIKKNKRSGRIAIRKDAFSDVFPQVGPSYSVDNKKIPFQKWVFSGLRVTVS